MVGAPRSDVCWDLTYKPGAVRTSKPNCEACLCGLARYLTDRTRQLEIASFTRSVTPCAPNATSNRNESHDDHWIYKAALFPTIRPSRFLHLGSLQVEGPAQCGTDDQRSPQQAGYLRGL